MVKWIMLMLQLDSGIKWFKGCDITSLEIQWILKGLGHCVIFLGFCQVSALSSL